jgi:DNA-binding XRE family transcriptional regulator
MMPEARTARRALAWNVLELRQGARLTIERAAWDAGLAPRHWQKIEGGQANPTLETMVKIAVIFGTDLSALFAPIGR